MKKFKTVRNLRVKSVVVNGDYVSIHVAQSLIPAYFAEEKEAKDKDKLIATISMRKESFLNDLRENSMLMDLALLKFSFEEAMVYFKRAKVTDVIYLFEKGDKLRNPRFKEDEDFDYNKLESEKFYSHVLSAVELHSEAIALLGMMLKK